MSPPDGDVAVGRAGRLLLRRDAAARRQHPAAARPLAGRPAADVRGDGDRARAARARPRAAGGSGRRSSRSTRTRSRRSRSAPGPSVGGQTAGVARRRRAAAADPRDHARRVGVPRPARDPGDLALPRRAPVHLRYRRAGVPRRLRAGRVAHRDVRRELELARAGVVPDEHRDPARPAPAARVLRRQPEGRMPDRLGQRDEPAARSPTRSARA